MRFGYCEACLEHDTGPRHPESPDRLRAIRQALADKHGVEYVVGDPIDIERVLAVHGEEYVEGFEQFCRRGGGDWDADTVASEESWDAARRSAGLAEWAATTALEGGDGRDTPFALGRPPGHHAVEDDAMGFCFFNNAPIAAQSVIDRGLADRVAIFDWDVHHGNGIQDICYDSGDIFYASIHEDGLYPATGAVSETGEKDGAGTTMNIPFPPGTTQSAYLAALSAVIGPAFTAFDPDLILVSAGFDAHEHDPISRMRVSTEGYGLLAEQMRELAADAGAALGFVLEGGYGLDTLSSSVSMVHEVFGGYEPAPDEGDVAETARDVLDRVTEQGFPGVPE